MSDMRMQAALPKRRRLVSILHNDTRRFAAVLDETIERLMN